MRLASRSLLAAVTTLLLAASASAARAQDSAEEGQRNLGLMLSASSYHGFGAGASLGTRSFGVRAAAGWVPILLTIQDQNGDNTDIKFYSSAMVSPDLYVRLFGPPRVGFGLQGGWRWSSVTGSGFAASAYGQIRFTRRLDGLVNIGFMTFPDGEKEFKKHEHLPDNTKFSAPGPSFIIAAGFTLLVFP